MQRWCGHSPSASAPCVDRWQAAGTPAFMQGLAWTHHCGAWALVGAAGFSWIATRLHRTVAVCPPSSHNFWHFVLHCVATFSGHHERTGACKRALSALGCLAERSRVSLCQPAKMLQGCTPVTSDTQTMHLVRIQGASVKPRSIPQRVTLGTSSRTLYTMHKKLIMMQGHDCSQLSRRGINVALTPHRST